MQTGLIQAIIVSTSLFIPQHTPANIIAAWNFNSSPPDPTPFTGTVAPTVGHATARAIGGTTSVFQMGSPNDPSPDNSSWGIYNFPPQTMGNKTAGAEFRISTVGFQDVRFQVETRPLPNASRFARLQYTLNGTDFIDLKRLDFGATNGYQRVDCPFNDIPDAGNNPDFGVRIVTEFEGTILLNGANRYVTTSDQTYFTFAPIRFDQVIVSGNLINPNNSPPAISPINDTVVLENQSTPPIPFTINDPESPQSELQVAAISSNPDLIPAANVQILRDNNPPTITVTPRPDRIGSSSISVNVIDPEGRISTERFTIVVQSRNSSPTLSEIPRQELEMNGPPRDVALTIADEESAPDDLHLSGHTSNPRLIDAIQFSGSGSNRTITITPTPNQVGTAIVSVHLSDGRDITRTRFPVVIHDTPRLLLQESFPYPDGSLEETSESNWTAHSIGANHVQSIAGKVRVSSDGNQDLHLPLPGGAYGDAAPLHTGFTVSFSELPSFAGSYFAHFNRSSFKTRIFAHQVNAASGCFRMGIANGAGTRAEWPQDLKLDTPYRIVTRFDAIAGQSTLWINPTNASGGLEAVDNERSGPVSSFALRQSRGIGTLTLSDLKLGTSFDEVAAESPATLTIQSLDAHNLKVSWPSGVEEYQLQTSINTPPDDWIDVTTAPELDQHHWVVLIPNESPNRLFRLRKLE